MGSCVSDVRVAAAVATMGFSLGNQIWCFLHSNLVVEESF